MVKDKVNYRAKGPRTQLTRQPVSGRANDGGLRIGEMERDVMIAHGATDFLRESMLDRGDQYFMAICNKTGAIAIYNPDKNLFMSPMADGPLKYVDSLDGKEMNVEHITKYGRSFSVVRVPYVFKLLMHELQAINIKMCIITEDNINQFDNMNFSQNIRLLTNGVAASPDDVITQTRIALKEENVKLKVPKVDELDVQFNWEKELNENKEKGSSKDGEEDSWEAFMKKDAEMKKQLYGSGEHYGQQELEEEPEKVLEMSGGGDGRSSEKSSSIKYEPEDFVKDLAVNDIVIFAGDFKKDRKWLIRKITGTFAKIETNDLSGGLSPENAINIVNLYDIKRADKLIPEPGFAPVGHLEPMDVALQQQLMPVAPVAMQPPMQINVVTGNNNKLTESPAIETMPMIRKPANDQTANSSVSFSDLMTPTTEAPVSNSIDVIDPRSKSGPIIVKKI